MVVSQNRLENGYQMILPAFLPQKDIAKQARCLGPPESLPLGDGGRPHTPKLHALFICFQWTPPVPGDKITVYRASPRPDLQKGRIPMDIERALSNMSSRDRSEVKELIQAYYRTGDSKYAYEVISILENYDDDDAVKDLIKTLRR